MSAKYTQNKRIFRSPGAPARNEFIQNTSIKEEKSNQKSSFCRDRNLMNGFFSPKPKYQSIFFVDLKKKSQEKGRRKFKLRKKDSSCVLTKSSLSDSNDSMVMGKREKKKSTFSKFVNCPRMNTQRISKLVQRQHNSRNRNASMSSYNPIESDRMLSPIAQKEEHFSPSRNIIPLNISDQMTITHKIRQLNMRKKIKHPEGDTKVDQLLRTMVLENEHKEEIESKKRLSKIQLMALIKKRKNSIVKKYLGID
ncbi:unnamed protein product [Moneuplotes crassus]|uniref:Uncharacterized protein n=2 Tax=Euplotes crassus TaxID=5936 RepID=A0AAD1XEN2_EUPCR|nr:unnamed protein product [Moneuplotes crassus]